MVKLREEGIERLENRVKLNFDDTKGTDEALRKPGGSSPSSENARTSMIPYSGVRVGSRALIRLETAMETMKC